MRAVYVCLSVCLYDYIAVSRCGLHLHQRLSLPVVCTAAVVAAWHRAQDK